MIAWKSVLELAPPLLQAVSVAVTAVFAILGLRAWRQQLIGKRRIEVAEQGLLAAYKVKNAMTYIRSPLSFAAEGVDRTRAAHEEDDVAKAKDTYFVPLKRIQDTSDDFAEFEKARLLCQVYFGDESVAPFDEILQARKKVAIAARMLVDFVGEHGVDRGLYSKLQGDIWEGYSSNGDAANDAITKSVAGAVAAIEGLCRPHLRA